MKPKLNLKLGNLDGPEGNAFVILGRFRREVQKEGWTDKEIKEVVDEAKSGDYDHLLEVIEDYCN